MTAKKIVTTMLVGLGVTFFIASAVTTLQARPLPAAPPAIDSDDIGGVVTSAKGPEGGVWVIAETMTLPTRFIKIVVTDDDGRYLLPDLPPATFKIWVRGYGLVDSKPITATPGKIVNLAAIVAPSPRAAANYYPANYWFSLLQVPPKSDFPIKSIQTQEQWIDTMKLSTLLVWQMGDKATRELPERLGKFSSQTEAWQKLVTKDESPVNVGRMGDRGISMFADWTDRIAQGEYPKEAPPRPQGVERNVVISEWDWSDKIGFVHDEIATDKRSPSLNANGYIYGVEQFSNDVIDILDPRSNSTSRVEVPIRDMSMPLNRPQLAELTFPGERVHYAKANLHSPMMDQKGRLWMTAGFRAGKDQPAYCTDGSLNPSAKLFPIHENTQSSGARQLAVYDPATKKVTLVDTCAGTHHLQFAEDADNTLYTSGGRGVLAWINTRVFDQTGDLAKAEGWCPLVVDTNGNGKVDPWVDPKGSSADQLAEAVNSSASRRSDVSAPRLSGSAVPPGQTIDPTKDLRVDGNGYGLIVNPVDGTVWQANLGVPGYLTRTDPKSCLTEVYEPPFHNPKYPFDGYSPKGVDVDRNTGIIWTSLSSSGHVASFDRRKCKMLNGPTATGQHCPEGWTLYKEPGPDLKNSEASADYFYYNWVDQFNVFGLGANIPIANGDNSDALMALLPDSGKWITIRVPYPLGFYQRGMDARIDDPNAGWKGKALWSTYASVMPWHYEGGKGATSKVVKFQLRPDPLAR